MTPKRRVRVRLDGLDEATCSRIGGRMEGGKCVVEAEGEVLETEKEAVGVEGEGA